MNDDDKIPPFNWGAWQPIFVNGVVPSEFRAAIAAHYAKHEKVNSSDQASPEIQSVFTLTGKQLTMLRESKHMKQFDIDGRMYTVVEGKGIEYVRVNRDQLAAILDLRPMGEIKPGYWLTREGPYITDEQLDALAALVNNDERKCDE